MPVLQCIPGYGVHVMYKMFNEAPPKMIVMGGGCSKVSQPTAESSHYWNVVQVSSSMSYSIRGLLDSYPPPSGPLGEYKIAAPIWSTMPYNDDNLVFKSRLVAVMAHISEACRQRFRDSSYLFKQIKYILHTYEGQPLYC